MTGESSSKPLGAARLGIGFIQGVILWLLYEAAEAHILIAEARGAMQLVALFAPLILIGGLGSLRTRTLLIWTGAAAVVLAGLGLWDAWRETEHLYRREPTWPSAEFILAAASSLFIAHHLVEISDRSRRWIGPFTDYFDTGWKHGVQLALSGGFVGALWLLLFLGALLFQAIGIEALSDIIEEPWFIWPVTAVALAAAVHLTDVRTTLVRGVRMVALVLLSWLLPLLVVIVAPFLVSVMIVGLDELLGDVSAAGLLLWATAALIVLTNAAYQDGEAAAPPVLQWAARISCLLLVPLVGLAAYAIGLRIAQHGLTPERVVGVACVIVGACHAVGYAWAAIDFKNPWLKRLERTNIVSAVIGLAVLLAIFSPLADPARLSVANQMARLKSGAVDAAAFDYDFLRIRSGRFGREALDDLARSGAGPKPAVVIHRAKEAKMKTSYWDDTSVVETRKSPDQVQVKPAGRTLPKGFFGSGRAARKDVRETCLMSRTCSAYVVDLDGDRRDEILLQPDRALPTVYAQREDGQWTLVGKVQASCDQAWTTVTPPQIVAPKNRFQEIILGGVRYHVTPTDCSGQGEP